MYMRVFCVCACVLGVYAFTRLFIYTCLLYIRISTYVMYLVCMSLGTISVVTLRSHCPKLSFLYSVSKRRRLYSHYTSFIPHPNAITPWISVSLFLCVSESSLRIVHYTNSLYKANSVCKLLTPLFPLFLSSVFGLFLFNFSFLFYFYSYFLFNFLFFAFSFFMFFSILLFLLLVFFFFFFTFYFFFYFFCISFSFIFLFLSFSPIVFFTISVLLFQP